MEETAYVHVYTGNGKGKTTSSIGLVIRSLGAGNKVFFSQFMKNGNYSEIIALEKISGTSFQGQLEIHQFGKEGRSFQKLTDEDKNLAQKGFEMAMNAVSCGNYDLVILDEVNVAVNNNLIEENQLVELIENRDVKTELVLTGRYASDKIIEKADLVSEINAVKHYARNGVPARIGIEL